MTNETFSLLDPWCYAAGQPIKVTYEEFGEAWNGYALLAEKREKS